MTPPHRASSRTLLALLVTLVLVVAVGGCSDVKPKPRADRLPEVTLTGIGGGRPVDLGAFKGPAVVNLWASWCGPCKAELPRYAAFAKAYQGKVGVLGVDWQETRPDAAEALIKSSGVAYPNVGDPDGDVRTKELPRLILVDTHGKVVYNQALEIKSVTQLESLVAKHLGVEKAAA